MLGTKYLLQYYVPVFITYTYLPTKTKQKEQVQLGTNERWTEIIGGVRKLLIAHILRKMLASVGGAGVGGGLQPLPAVQGAGAVGMRAPQFEARGNVNVGPASQLKSIAGQVTSLEDQRGDLCGDPCLTIELSEKKSAAAVWDEENFSVIHLTAVDKNKKEVTRMPSSMHTPTFSTPK